MAIEAKIDFMRQTEKMLADSITVVSKNKVVVRFRGGMEVEVRKNLGHKRRK